MYKRTKQTKIDKQYCDQYKNNTTIDIGKTKDRYRFDRDALTGYWRCLKAGLALRKKNGTVDSLLTDTSVKRTPRVGPCLSLLPLFDSL